MKALSIREDPAQDIADGLKTKEYRLWPTNHRGDLLIVTTATPEHRGYALCVVTVTDCKFEARDGVYAWSVKSPRFIKPFPVRGQQRLYDVDDSLIEYDDSKDVEHWGEVWDRFFEREDVMIQPKRKRKVS